jgi:hypothetical protein
VAMPSTAAHAAASRARLAWSIRTPTLPAPCLRRSRDGEGVVRPASTERTRTRPFHHPPPQAGCRMRSGYGVPPRTTRHYRHFIP